MSEKLKLHVVLGQKVQFLVYNLVQYYYSMVKIPELHVIQTCFASNLVCPDQEICSYAEKLPGSRVEQTGIAGKKLSVTNIGNTRHVYSLRYSLVRE